MSIYVKNGVLHVSGVQDKIRGKGQEWPDFISDYTMLDIETTGLNPYRDHVTELGAVKVRANQVVDEFSQLVVYPRSNHVPHFITKLNGITEEMLLNEGKPIKEAMTAFRTFIGSDIIIGYNVNFDLNFLYDLTQKFHLPKLSNDYVDVLRLARVYYPQQHNRLLDCIQRAGIAQVEQHHGLADSLDTKKVYDDFRQHFTPELLQEAQGKLKNIDLLEEELEVWKLGFRNPVNNKKIAFAPEIEMNSAEAAQMVNNMNGVAQTGVKADTDYLIMSDDGFFSKNNPETLKAKEYNHAGSKIKRLSESYFLNMLDEWARS
ncbi:ribonuclease H-like domain-containing protein [Lactobacillus sp. M0398]|uniref:exonuclease domain-containing protein n=1 Tax=unclassified Lactobacillus TaxID=2620435 RepID=UPI0018DE8EEE|nr:MULTISPECIES: exonuclease domain-containing protein [unclassified Lactobacillus]MBI0121096.1 ribonuclease H-like domain-containing protein [Lactobacillus sp. M0398]MBI0123243.1 ribonuclease H-like domain-containing protein [Lactobacillus sp. W8174]MBI0135411.1 ribonuclease H-like domain-containing protein [Lactobacillus sp. W8173]